MKRTPEGAAKPLSRKPTSCEKEDGGKSRTSGRHHLPTRTATVGQSAENPTTGRAQNSVQEFERVQIVEHVIINCAKKYGTVLTRVEM